MLSKDLALFHSSWKFVSGALADCAENLLTEAVRLWPLASILALIGRNIFFVFLKYLENYLNKMKRRVIAIKNERKLNANSKSKSAVLFWERTVRIGQVWWCAICLHEIHVVVNKTYIDAKTMKRRTEDRKILCSKFLFLLFLAGN